MLSKPALLVLVSALLTACGGNDTESLENLVARSAAGITTLSTRSPTSTLALGETRQFLAVAGRSDGSESNLSDVTWHTDTPDIVRVSDQGEVTALAMGTAIIWYDYLGQTSTLSIEVTAATIQSLQLSPLQINADECSQTTVTAEAVYSDGSAQAPSATTRWAISNQEVAKLIASDSEAHTVHLRAINAGTATLTATDQNVTTSAEVIVEDSLAGIATDEDLITIETGSTLSFAVYGDYSDGSRETIGAVVSLVDTTLQEPLLSDGTDAASSDTEDTTTDNQHLPILSTDHAVYTPGDNNEIEITATAAGTDMISIGCGGLTTQLEIQVSDPVVLQEVSIDSESTEMQAGDTVQLTAIASYSDNTSAEIEAPAWSIVSGDAERFTFAGDTGELTANADIVIEQSVVIELTQQGFSDTITITAEKGVTETADKVTIYYTDANGDVLPTSTDTVLSVVAGGQIKLSPAIGFNTGREAFAAEGVYWSNADPEVAVVNAQGLLHAIAAGITNITAVDQSGNRATISVIVTAAAADPAG